MTSRPDFNGVAEGGGVTIMQIVIEFTYWHSFCMIQIPTVNVHFICVLFFQEPCALTVETCCTQNRVDQMCLMGAAGRTANPIFSSVSSLGVAEIKANTPSIGLSANWIYAILNWNFSGGKNFRSCHFQSILVELVTSTENTWIRKSLSRLYFSKSLS